MKRSSRRISQCRRTSPVSAAAKCKPSVCLTGICFFRGTLDWRSESGREGVCSVHLRDQRGRLAGELFELQLQHAPHARLPDWQRNRARRMHPHREPRVGSGQPIFEFFTSSQVTCILKTIGLPLHCLPIQSGNSPSPVSPCWLGGCGLHGPSSQNRQHCRFRLIPAASHSDGERLWPWRFDPNWLKIQCLPRPPLLWGRRQAESTERGFR